MKSREKWINIPITDKLRDIIQPMAVSNGRAFCREVVELIKAGIKAVEEESK